MIGICTMHMYIYICRIYYDIWLKYQINIPFTHLINILGCLMSTHSHMEPITFSPNSSQLRLRRSQHSLHPRQCLRIMLIRVAPGACGISSKQNVRLSKYFPYYVVDVPISTFVSITEPCIVYMISSSAAAAVASAALKHK